MSKQSAFSENADIETAGSNSEDTTLRDLLAILRSVHAVYRDDCPKLACLMIGAMDKAILLGHRIHELEIQIEKGVSHEAP